MGNIKKLKITILGYTNNSYPGWVKCCFDDIHGETHYFEEKVPVITKIELNQNSTFPKEETILCQVINLNNNMIAVDISNPWGIEDENGESVFVVNSDKIE